MSKARIDAAAASAMQLLTDPLSHEAVRVR